MLDVQLRNESIPSGLDLGLDALGRLFAVAGFALFQVLERLLIYCMSNRIPPDSPAYTACLRITSFSWCVTVERVRRGLTSKDEERGAWQRDGLSEAFPTESEWEAILEQLESVQLPVGE
jgi:hypothetical protein